MTSHHTEYPEGTLLPFLKVSLNHKQPETRYTGVSTLCLVDSGSTKKLVSSNFFYHNFPHATLSPTKILLKYAAQGRGEFVDYSTELYMTIKADSGVIIQRQPFLIVPNIRFNVYLGQTFISSQYFGFYHPNYICFIPGEPLTSMRITEEILNQPYVQRARLEYHSKDSYANVVDQNNSTRHLGANRDPESNQGRFNTKQSLPKSSTQTSNIQPANARVNKGNSKTEQSSIDSPKTRSQIESCYSIEHQKGENNTQMSSSCKEFEREMDRYDIEPETREQLWESYNENGEAPIPVSKLIEESGKVDTFYENSEIYYSNLEELMDILNLSHLPPQEQNNFKQFLITNMDVFSTHDLDIGTVKNYEAKVTLRDEVSHFEMKHVPIAKNLQERVGQMLIRYANSDIIEEVKESVLDPLISNLIPLKKGANKIRLVLDLRPINHFSRKTKSSHTSLFETLYSVDLNATHFSTIDLSSSYYSIKLHPSCYRYFCFYFGNRLYNLKRTAMGHMNSHNHLARVLSKIFPNKKNLRIYLDDLIITHHGSIAEAVQDVMSVLSDLRAAGLKVSPKKAALFRTSVIFLGFLLRRGQICIPDQKIQGFLAVPPPTNRLSLRKFINSLSFFRTNIPNFSELAANLSELVNKTDRSKKATLISISQKNTWNNLTS